MTARLPRGVVPLLSLGTVVVLVTLGLARGLWLSNLHNALLAAAFTAVGAYVAARRPGHGEGRLFVATGLLHAVMFYGRQVGHGAGAGATGWDAWWGWLGVWPIALSIALATLAVLCFPDGRLPSPRWRPVATVLVVLALLGSTVSATWPVEYADAGVLTPHPLASVTPGAVAAVWDAAAHPAYAVAQLLWPIAIAARWRGASGLVRRQLAWLLLAAAGSTLALVTGLVVWDSPRAGVLAAGLLPVAAGLAIVHGHHAAAYSALTWLSRRGSDEDLPTDLARAVSEALGAHATVWTGSRTWHVVGVWPATHAAVPSPTTPEEAAREVVVRPVVSAARVVGGLGVARDAPLTRAEERLLDHLVSQAGLMLDYLDLGELIEQQRREGRLDDLTPREHEVLGLIARGLSNRAICEELHLSVKTVEPVVGSIFAKLQLHSDSASNRRVLAALAYLRA